MVAGQSVFFPTVLNSSLVILNWQRQSFEIFICRLDLVGKTLSMDTEFMDLKDGGILKYILQHVNIKDIKINVTDILIVF